MPAEPARAKSLFLAAADLPDPTERAAFLDRECGADAELRARVEALLRADAGSPPDATAAFGQSLVPGDFAPDAATGTFGDPTRTSRPAGGSNTAAGLGMVIAGRYTLVEVIGEGGMGSVYLASQSEPVKRQVALKLIKAGMDSKGVLARFDAERQALALMDHPNIARIYDGGVTEKGQPFFVMELVQGVPLTEYCDSKRLTVDARLRLFVQVCQAVQHAHQKGVIHRDLKPGNVLVTEVDGRPTPKVIDFGVAKATEQRLTDLSLADTGAIVGTPAYMSPEQADPTSMDIDTRTDVYALGVILYELLTGSPPIDSKQFKRGAILEMLRMVREVEPPRPSTKLSTADALPNIAASRSIDPAKLAHLLKGELDWVVMKALEKDRTRRYDTANAFAQDIVRYLANEVVEARPPSRGYRLRKFVRRNRGAVTAAAVVFLALVAGVVGTTLGLMEADAQRKYAEGQEAVAKGETAEKEKARAEEEKARKELEVAFASRQYDEVVNVEATREAGMFAHHVLRLLKTLPESAHELRTHAKLQIAMFTASWGVWGRQARIENESTRYRFRSNEVICERHDGSLALADPMTGERRVTLTVPGVRLKYLTHSETADVLVAVDRIMNQRKDDLDPYATHPYYAFDTQTGRLLSRTGVDLPVADAIDLSRDGTRLLTKRGRRDGAFRVDEEAFDVWDTATGRRAFGLPSSAATANLSPDGRFIVTYGSYFVGKPPAPVRVYSATDGKLLRTLPADRGAFVYAAVTPSGRYLVTFTNDLVQWWSTSDWKPVGRPSKTRSNRWKGQPIYDEPLGGRQTGLERVLGVRYFVRDSVAVLCGTANGNSAGMFESMIEIGIEVFARDQVEPVVDLGTARLLYLTESGAVLNNGQFVGVNPVRVSSPGRYRRYSDDARAYTADGRFMPAANVAVTVVSLPQLPEAPTFGSINFAAEKPLTFGIAPVRIRGRDYYLGGGGDHFLWSGNGPPLVPTSVGDYDPDLLALWVGVTTFGELTAANVFQPWDLATWEAKRAELARRIIGRPEAELMTTIAEDRLRGLRQQVRVTTDKTEAIKLLERLSKEESYYVNHFGLARLRAETGDLTAAAADLREALRRYRLSPERPLDVAAPIHQPGDPPIVPVSTALALATGRPDADYELVREWVKFGPPGAHGPHDDALARYRLGQYRELEAELYPKASGDLAKIILPLAFAPSPLATAFVVRGRFSSTFQHVELSREDATLLAMCEFRLGRAAIAKQRLLDRKYRPTGAGLIGLALMKEAYTLVGVPLPKMPAQSEFPK